MKNTQVRKVARAPPFRAMETMLEKVLTAQSKERKVRSKLLNGTEAKSIKKDKNLTLSMAEL